MQENMNRPEEAMANAGLIFIFTVWLQGQMSDLVILKKNPELIADFVSDPTRVPPTGIFAHCQLQWVKGSNNSFKSNPLLGSA